MTIILLLQCKNKNLEELLLCVQKLSNIKAEQILLLEKAAHWITMSQAEEHAVIRPSEVTPYFSVGETPISGLLRSGSESLPDLDSSLSPKSDRQ